MSEVFISHSSKDRSIVQCFVELLILGTGIPREQIFCTSMEGTLASGCDFYEKIRQEIREAKVVIPLITENYLNSNMCMMELGAAWILQGEDGKTVCPMLGRTIRFEQLSGIPLGKMQGGHLNQETDLAVLYDHLLNHNILQAPNTSGFTAAVKRFLSQVEPGESTSIPVLKPKSDGYYYSEIAEERTVPSEYRCYRLKGIIKAVCETRTDVSVEESHWLLYYAGVYPDLNVGDQVKFKFKRTKLRDYPDLKNARDIYPTVLQRV